MDGITIAVAGLTFMALGVLLAVVALLIGLVVFIQGWLRRAPEALRTVLHPLRPSRRHRPRHLSRAA
ncbi:MAG TPA: hypothetical protein VE975_07065 [Actinomycetota bacterium]|nr:hypothetical protein [Actinomycetota bacterium]